MTDRDKLAKLVQVYGVDGLMDLLGDYLEDWAEQQEVVTSLPAEAHGAVARVCRRTSLDVRGLLR